jgi:tetratricopeptide (TPR) repeat protein
VRPGTKARGWRRHLDGWQAGLLVVVLGGGAIVLSLPRAVRPELLPEVSVDRAALEAIAAREAKLAAEAEETRLDVDIRAVGTEFRAYNRAAAADDENKLVAARGRLSEAAVVALKLSPEALASLRAFELQRFLEELARWRKDGTVSEELIELSGDFVDVLRRNRWCRGADRQLVADEHVLRVLWKKRWNDITGVRGPLFDLTADEDRVRYGFLIQHPFQRRVDVQRPSFQRAEEVLAQKGRLAAIERLSQIDPSYPAQLARGVVLYQMASYAEAAEAFRQHLAANPDGPYSLLVNNYLKDTLDRVNEVGVGSGAAM